MYSKWSRSIMLCKNCICMMVAGELLEMGHGLFARGVCEYCQWFRASMAQKGNTGFHVGGKGIAMILNVGTTLNLGGVEADFII